MHSFFARHRKSTIFRVMLLFSLFTVFSNCINPITPALFLELGFPDYMFGVGYAAMAGACFLLSPVWGKLCEKYGYTNILGGSFIGYALVQVVFSISTSQSVVILCRFMGGAAYSAGAVASLAYLIAVAPSGQNHRLMLYYSATTTVGCAAGYAIGGFIGTVSIQLMFRIQILVLLILGAVLFSILKDPEVSIKVQESVSKQSGQKCRRMKLFDPLFFLTVFLSNFAASGYDNAYNYYVKEALNFPNYYNGLIRAGIGLITLVMTVTIGTWIAKKFDLRLSLIPVLLLCGTITYGVCLLRSPAAFVIGNFLYYAVNALYLPFQQGILSDSGGPEDSGHLAGQFNSFQFGGKVFGALCAGFIYSLGNKLPFIISSAIFFLSVAFALADFGQQRHRARHRVPL